jgi:putative acetyltransferase
MNIRSETTNDLGAIQNVHRLAFGQEAEGHLVDELRNSGYARLSLVAEENGKVVGHVLFSDLAIRTATGTIDSLALAPLAVVPEFQCMGIGSALVREGLRLCREQGHKIVVVLGHTEFYPRFGFTSKLAEQFIDSSHFGPALMALELVPGSLKEVTGRLEYAPPFQNL